MLEQEGREEACWTDVSKVMSRVLRKDSTYKMRYTQDELLKKVKVSIGAATSRNTS